MSRVLDLPKNKGTTREKSDRQEKALAKRLGGRTTPGSGAGFIKGDISTPGEYRPFELPTAEMIEAKTTARTQFTVRLADLEKLSREAAGVRRRPVFVIQLDDEGRGIYSEREWALIPMSHYEHLTKNERSTDV